MCKSITKSSEENATQKRIPHSRNNPFKHTPTLANTCGRTTLILSFGISSSPATSAAEINDDDDDDFAVAVVVVVAVALAVGSDAMLLFFFSLICSFVFDENNRAADPVIRSKNTLEGERRSLRAG